MRRLAAVAALLLCSELVLAQQSAPSQEGPPPGSAQPSASQDSTPPKPSQEPGAPGTQQHPRGQRFQRGQGVAGTISAINGNTVTIKSFDGTTATVNVKPDTMLRKDQQQAKLSDFKVGDMVMVRGEAAGTNAWTASIMGTRSEANQRFREGMGKQFIMGEIKSIDGANLTIARVDGVTQTITANENTSFRKHGESVTLADFAPGEHVFVRGEMKDGVFVPTMLSAGGPGGMGGMGGGPMGGPAGPPPGQGPPQEGSNPHQ